VPGLEDLFEVHRLVRPMKGADPEVHDAGADLVQVIAWHRDRRIEEVQAG
jgi:hypothetical protein